LEDDVMNRYCVTYRVTVLALLALLTFPLSAHGQRKKRPLVSRSTAAVAFTESCADPSFPSAKATPIDTACGISGTASGAGAEQNKLKNNFCAIGDSPKQITIEDLNSLQGQVENFSPTINFGDKNSPDRPKGPTSDRGPLRQMGEGTLVALRGFVLKARQEGAESVNCSQKVADEPVNHDIHIAIVSSQTETSECAGVVVEMSPHHRPPEWTAAHLNKVSAAGLPVRITGQLFFDSAHVPCSQGRPAKGNPARVSLWEVHPISVFEVCTGDCDGEGKWAPLADWVKNN
jgi:hypothetical protein